MAYGTFQPTPYNAAPLYQGFASFGDQIGRAIEERKKADDEDKDFAARSRAAESFLDTHAQDFGFSADQVKDMLKTNKDETPRGRYLRMTDTVNNAATGLTIKAHLKQQEADQMKIDAMKRAATQEASNNAALRAAGYAQANAPAQARARTFMPDGSSVGGAFMPGGLSVGGGQVGRADIPGAPVDPYAGFNTYVQSGNDPEMAKLFAQIGENSQKKHQLPAGVMNLGQVNGQDVWGVQGPNGEIQLLNKEAPLERPSTANVGGTNMTAFGGGLFGEDGQPINIKPPVAPSIETYALNPELWKAQADAYLEYTNQQKALRAKRAGAGARTFMPDGVSIGGYQVGRDAGPGASVPGAPGASAAPTVVHSKAELDALKPGTPFFWPGKGGGTKNAPKK